MLIYYTRTHTSHKNRHTHTQHTYINTRASACLLYYICLLLSRIQRRKPRCWWRPTRMTNGPQLQIYFSLSTSPSTILRPISKPHFSIIDANFMHKLINCIDRWLELTSAACRTSLCGDRSEFKSWAKSSWSAAIVLRIRKRTFFPSSTTFILALQLRFG